MTLSHWLPHASIIIIPLCEFLVVFTETWLLIVYIIFKKSVLLNLTESCCWKLKELSIFVTVIVDLQGSQMKTRQNMWSFSVVMHFYSKFQVPPWVPWQLIPGLAHNPWEASTGNELFRPSRCWRINTTVTKHSSKTVQITIYRVQVIKSVCKLQRGKLHSKHYPIGTTLNARYSTQYCIQDVQGNPIWVRNDMEGNTRLHVETLMLLLLSSHLAAVNRAIVTCQ